MAHKNTRRKYAAAGLALLGVAGLSLAAASTLQVDTAPEIAVGSGAFAPCDTDGVKVDYAYAKSGSTYVISDVTVSGIAAACEDETILVSLTNPAGTELSQGTGTVTGTSWTYSATSSAIDIASDLGGATVIISD